MGDRRGGVPSCLLAALAARVADEGTPVAVVLLAVERTGGVAEGALVLTAWAAPQAVAAPLVGTMAARVRRVRLAFAIQLAVLAAATAALSEAVGRVGLPAVLAVAMVGGCCGPALSGGLSSLVARLAAPGAARARACARDAAVYNVAGLTGPALAGAAAVTLSPAVALLLLAALAAAAAAVTAWLPLGDGSGPPPSGVGPGRDLVDGVRILWIAPELRAVTAASCLAFVGVGALTTLTVLLAESRAVPGSGGLLLTVFAAGGVAAALLLARFPPAAGPGAVLVVGLLATGAGLGAAAVVPSSTVVAACYLVAGAGDGVVLAATLRLRADHSPDRRRPQVFTTGAGLKISAAALGAALAATATVGDVQFYLLGAALLQPCAALGYAALRRR